MRRAAQPLWRADTRRVLVTRVKRETLGKLRDGAWAKGRFTLHDASLGGHMDAAAHNVNGKRANGFRPQSHTTGLFLMIMGTKRER